MGKCIFETRTPFERFGIMFDNSRIAVMRPETVRNMIDIMESLGYNMLMLYTEDTFEVKGQPYFGHLRGRYTEKELKELDAYAQAHGVELVPCVQTLAHLNCLMYWKEYAEISDCNDILCVGEEKVYQLIEDIFRTLSECFKSRLVNIGMDEADMVGLGRYLKKHGYRNRVDILSEHLNRVAKIAKRYGFTAYMWSDMFFKLACGGYADTGKDCGEVDLSVQTMIPENVNLIYWDYNAAEKSHYDGWIEGHELLKPGSMYAGGLWSWHGFVPHNGYAIRAGKVATQSCLDHQLKNVFYTAWGDNGGECSRYAIMPSLFYNACIAHGVTEEAEIKNRFQEVFGIAFDEYMLVDLPKTANADDDFPNPDKYMLYCDCFLGKFDLSVRKEEGVRYAEAAKRMEALAEHPVYGNTFATLKALSKVLEIKYTLGVRTREAYRSGDKEQIRELLPVYEELLRRLEFFYEMFRRQWLSENKPHGLDVQDTRIGGLIWRIKDQKRRLEEYITGQIPKIEELEEPVLDYFCRGDAIAEEDKHAFFYNNGWGASVTASII